MHEDRAIQESIALAMGQECIHATASAFEAEGDQLSAAKLCWIGDGLQRRGMIPRERGYDFVYRAASLLEACASDATHDFELEVLNQAFAMDFGSDRHKAVMKRLEVVSGGTVTYESKIGEGLVSWAAGAQACGMYGGERSQWPNPTWAHLEEFLEGEVVCVEKYMEAKELGPTKPDRDAVHICNFLILGFHPIFTHFPRWQNALSLLGGKSALAELIRSYDYVVDGPVHKRTGAKYDSFRAGSFTWILALCYGDFESLSVWHRKAIAINHELKLAETHEYGPELMEVGITVQVNPHVYLLLGDHERANEYLRSLGFVWSGVGVERYTTTVRGAFGDHMSGGAAISVYLKLLIFLSSAEGEIDAAEVNAWMPSLDDLKDYDKLWVFHVQGLMSTLALGARAFERLGRDDDAIAAAQAGIELNKKKVRHARTSPLIHF